MNAHRTRLALLTTLSAAALALSGCGLLGGAEEPAPEDPGTVEQEDEGAADEGTSDDGGDDAGDTADDTEDTEPGTDDADTADGTGDAEDGEDGGDPDAADDAAPVDTEIAAPGTQVAVGEPATVHVQAGEEDEEYYGYAVVSTTVTEIVEGDPAIIENFPEDDQEELEAMTPWYVHADHEILSIDGEPNANMTPRLDPQDATGGTLIGAVSFGGSIDEACSYEGYEAKEPGAVASSCSVVFTDGEPPARVAWVGDDTADGYDGPYAEDPVVWLHEG